MPHQPQIAADGGLTEKNSPEAAPRKGWRFWRRCKKILLRGTKRLQAVDLAALLCRMAYAGIVLHHVSHQEKPCPVYRHAVLPTAR